LRTTSSTDSVKRLDLCTLIVYVQIVGSNPLTPSRKWSSPSRAKDPVLYSLVTDQAITKMLIPSIAFKKILFRSMCNNETSTLTLPLSKTWPFHSSFQLSGEWQYALNPSVVCLMLFSGLPICEPNMTDPGSGDNNPAKPRAR